MLEFALTEPYAPFTIAFLVMVGVGLIEAIGLGMGSLHLDADLDGHFDGGSVLSWLGFGTGMPVLIWLTSLLACFVLAGFGIQQAAEAMQGHPLSWQWAVGAAVPSALVLNFFAANGLHRILPRDETTAIHPGQLVGSRVVVLESEARRGRPSRGRVVDQYGQAHYVMVEPDGDVPIPAGMSGILVSRDGPIFVAVPDIDITLGPVA